jgi:hypothetical protein
MCDVFVDVSKYVSFIGEICGFVGYFILSSVLKMAFLALIRVFVGEIRGFIGDFILSSVLTKNWAFWLLQRSVD